MDSIPISLQPYFSSDTIHNHPAALFLKDATHRPLHLVVPLESSGGLVSPVTPHVSLPSALCLMDTHKPPHLLAPPKSHRLCNCCWSPRHITNDSDEPLPSLSEASCTVISFPKVLIQLTYRSSTHTGTVILAAVRAGPRTDLPCMVSLAALGCAHFPHRKQVLVSLVLRAPQRVSLHPCAFPSLESLLLLRT